MDIVLAIILVLLAYVIFKSLWVALIVLAAVAVAVYIIRRVRGSRNV